MNEKNFYSFYKLNNDEIKKLEEKISENISKENNIRNSAPVKPVSEQIISPAPEKTVKKKSLSQKKITTVAVSVVMFVLGLIIGLKFIPDRNSGNNNTFSEPEPITTEKITATKTEPVTEKATKKNNSEKKTADNLCVNINDWENWVYEDVGADATFTCYDDGLDIHVKDTGLGDYFYYVQGKYANLTLTKNTLYHIGFDYRSSNTMDFEFLVQHNDKPYNYYYGDVIKAFASDSYVHYSGYFLMPEDDDNANIAFNCCNGSIKTPYGLNFRRIFLSPCELNDDFYRDAGDGAGYYDKNNNYHKYVD